MDNRYVNCLGGEIYEGTNVLSLQNSCEQLSGILQYCQPKKIWAKSKMAKII